MQKLKKIFILLTALYSFAEIVPYSALKTALCSADAQEPSRQEIQAAMVIKFTDFIEWPQASFNEDSEEFTIAVLGQNEYQDLFEPFTTRLFYGKRLKLIHYTDIQNIQKIQILIVSQSEKKKIRHLLDKLKGKPILTIGDFPGFAENGGIINFFQKANNRIGFEINMESKKLSGIKISSHMLRLGKIVESGIESEDIGQRIESISEELKNIGNSIEKKGGKL